MHDLHVAGRRHRHPIIPSEGADGDLAVLGREMTCPATVPVAPVTRTMGPDVMAVRTSDGQFGTAPGAYPRRVAKMSP